LAALWPKTKELNYIYLRMSKAIYIGHNQAKKTADNINFEQVIRN